MGRPVTWLPRVVALHRSVNDSVRSHYSREDLEKLFEVQPRSAQLLMGLLPTVRVGQNLLVERSALASFLERLASADDPGLEFASIRAAGKPQAVRRKLRELVQRDVDAEMTAPPATVTLEPGSLLVRFANMEELATAMCWLAAVLDADMEGFAAKYEPVPVIDPAEAAEREADEADAAYFCEFLAHSA